MTIAFTSIMRHAHLKLLFPSTKPEIWYLISREMALPGLVSKMYSKIQSWGSEWNELQRQKGHKD